MSLGLDLKSAIEETGLSFGHYRDGVLLSSQEFIWLKSNSQVTKPFIREFFLEGNVAYDLDVRSGDVFLLSDTSTRYLIVHSTPDSFENTVYRHSVVLYKANALVSIVRPFQSRDSNSYLAKTHYSIVASGIYVTLTSPLYGHELNEDSPVGSVPTEIHEMYVPSSYGVKETDIVKVGSDSFLVKAVKKRRYEGVDVLELREDNSSETTTTTTTSSTTTTTTTTTAP